MLPYSLDTSLILYRRDLLERAGLTPPRTWDSLFDQAAELQEPPALHGVGFQLNPASPDAESAYLAMALSFGAAPVSPDGRTVSFASPEMDAFLSYVKRQFGRGLFHPDVVRWDDADNNSQFLDGRVIFICNPATPLVTARDSRPDLLDRIGVSPMPAGPTGQAFALSYLRDAIALSRHSQPHRQELAKDLARRLFSRDVYLRWLELGHASPAVKGLTGMSVWQDQRRASFLTASTSGIGVGHPAQPTRAWIELSSRQPVTTMLTRVLIDGWEPRRAMAEAETLAREIYTTYTDAEAVAK
jgi:multiple sugar transport system substrate-binding protein